MNILTLPAGPNFRECRFVCRGNTIEHRSPLTASVQVLELPGTRWLASFGLPPMTRATAETWLAFLASLEGMKGRFYAGPPDATSPRGVGTGVPLVKGASQTGTSLDTDGWTAGQTGILKAGDYIAWNTPASWREMHIVCADADSDGSGNATFALAPPIRESPADDATIVVSSPTCVMRLATDDEASWDVNQALHYGVRFNAEEAFRDTM